jgi:hypothetical protein
MPICLSGHKNYASNFNEEVQKAGKIHTRCGLQGAKTLVRTSEPSLISL